MAIAAHIINTTSRRIVFFFQALPSALEHLEAVKFIAIVRHLEGSLT
jgi:hypothetical protein